MGTGITRPAMDAGGRIPAEKQRDDAMQKIIGPLEEQLSDARRSFEQKDLEVLESMAYYMGHQWGTMHDGGWETAVDTGEEQEVMNYCLPTVRAAVASMIRGMPAPEVVAAHDTFDSRLRARATQALVKSL